jgi:hypothetical protein
MQLNLLDPRFQEWDPATYTLLRWRLAFFSPGSSRTPPITFSGKGTLPHHLVVLSCHLPNTHAGTVSSTTQVEGKGALEDRQGSLRDPGG